VNFAELGVQGSSVGSIIAENAKTLEQKVAGLQDRYEIFFKGTTKKYHEFLETMITT